MVYAEFGGQTECIMGNWKIENVPDHPSFESVFFFSFLFFSFLSFLRGRGNCSLICLSRAEFLLEFSCF